MKTVIVLGTGNSGAGAIHDYLLSREDFQSPFSGKEFRIVNDPNGIDQLYVSLYKNFSINGAAKSVESFLKFIKNSYNSNYNKKNKVYNSDILKLADEFTKNIVDISYNGCPQFFFDKITFYKKLYFYFKRFILRKKSKEIKMINMVMPCEEEKFLYFSEQFLNKLFESNKNYSENKNIVIEQGGNIFDPIGSTKYYGRRKIIIVQRCPKAIYWSMKRRNSLSYPGHDLKVFVNWYKKIMQKINTIEIGKIIHIKYENFFSDFKNEKNKLCKELEISSEIKDNFDLDHTKKNLFKFKDNLKNEEIEFINKELKDYIQC